MSCHHSDKKKSNKIIKTVPLISINYSLITIFIPGMIRWFRMNTEPQSNTFLTQKLIYVEKNKNAQRKKLDYSGIYEQSG